MPHFFRSLVPVVWLAAWAMSGCGKKDNQQARTPPGIPVEVASATQEVIPLEIRGIGNVEAYSSVSVKAQVAGQLQKVYFREGQDVRKGDLLFAIDPRTFQQAVREAEASVAQAVAALGQAEANAARDRATAANARSQYNRYAPLGAKGIISREQVEQYRTEAEAAARTADASAAAIESARAAVRAAEARVADARLQLGYTTIRAPISGRTGSLVAKEGNLVQNNSDTPLVVINQITPVYATFAVPEQSLADIRQYTAGRKLAVQAVPAQTQGPPAAGVLDFIDNAVDNTTGTIRLKAVFPNADRHLWPGQFVNVVLVLDTRNEVVVPTRAVQAGQQGSFVFVVKQDQTAEQRSIVTNRTYGDYSILAKGVRPGERVVVDGQDRVRPGGKLQIGGQGGKGGAEGGQDKQAKASR